MKAINLSELRVSPKSGVAFVAIFICCLGVSNSVVPTLFDPCPQFTNSYFLVDMVTFSADPKEGELLRITQNGMVLKDIKIPKLELQIFQGGIQIQDDTQTKDLDLKKGSNKSIEYDYQAPEIVPSGEYTGKILGFDVNKELQICWQFKMNFVDPSEDTNQTSHIETH